MQLRLDFGLSHSELDNPAFDSLNISNSLDIQIAHLEALIPGTTVTVESSSIGKGASGWAFAILFSNVNNAIIDIGGWLATGSALWKAVRIIQQRHSDRNLVVRDSTTAAALAIAASEPDRLVGCTWIKSLCVTSGNDGIGYDARDIWVTSLETPHNSVLLIMTSPSGLILQSLEVLPEPFR